MSEEIEVTPNAEITTEVLLEKIARIERSSESYERMYRDLDNKIDSVRQYIERHADDFDDEMKEHIKRIAENLGLDLTVTKSYTMTVDVQFEVTASMFEDWDNFNEYDLSVDVSVESDDYEIGDIRNEVTALDED